MINSVLLVLSRAILLALLLMPGARAQEKIWRLGFLTPGDTEASFPGSIRGTTLPFLAERGFVEGRNLVLVPAPAEGDLERLPKLAETLAGEQVDAIISVGTLATRAAMKARPGTPIVMSFANEDPVETGFARSLAHPGGAVTGIYFRPVENDAKRLELLGQALPGARVLGFIAAPTLEPSRQELLARTAVRLGVSLDTEMVRTVAEFAAAFDRVRSAGAPGALVMASTLFSRDAALFGPMALARGIATICEWDYMAGEGCVLGYGPDLVELRRLTGDYVARIFKGENPAELPIQQPDRFRLAVNLKAAKVLGLTVPPALLARADEVIE